MQGPGVVGDDHCAPAQKAGEPSQREPATEVQDLAAHSFYYSGDEEPVFFDSYHGHACAFPGENVADGGELFRWPSAPFVTRPGVE